MSLIEILSIIIIHWIADFIFQDEKWALGKSKNGLDLIKHTLTYSIIWCIIGYVIAITLDTSDERALYMIKTILFFCITLFFHTITDYFTSRIVSKKFKNNQLGSAIPNFGVFTIIGFDQVLHYIQLFLTYYLLKQYF